jgi:hypothetical protein
VETQYFVDSRLVEELANPQLYSLEEAQAATLQRIAAGDLHLEDFVTVIQSESPPEDSFAIRMLDILAGICHPGQLLPLLNAVMPQSSPRIRSKAWGLFASASNDLSWALAQLDDENPRAVANVVEALWRAKPSPEVHEIFLRAAMQPRNRVAGNGLIGLIYYADPRAEAIAENMSRHPDPSFRLTVAWAIGHACWRNGVPILERLREDHVVAVRLRADQSMERIHARYDKAHPAGRA